MSQLAPDSSGFESKGGFRAKPFELENFYNAGTGWVCKRCEQELKETEAPENDENLPRVWREGEAESKRPKLAAPLAKWTNAARNQLVCPRCGVSELIDKA